MAGISVAIGLVSRANQAESGSASGVLAAMEMSNILSELNVALSFHRRNEQSVEFAITDQNDDGLAEWIHYSWSGVPGDPLTRQINGSSSSVVLNDVQHFGVEYFFSPADGEKPNVLLVVPNSNSLSNQDTAKRDWMASSGYTVKTISASLPAADFKQAEISTDVAYVSEETYSTDLNTKLRQSPLGILNEERNLYDDFGIASSSGAYTDDKIAVNNNTHQITSPFTLSNLSICTSGQTLIYAAGTISADVVTLANRPDSSSYMLMTLERNQRLYSGEKVSGRRVMLPWGGNDFDFASLNADAHEMLQRALRWAAGDCLVGIRLSLAHGSSSATQIVSRTEILNRPRVSGP